MKKKAKEVLRTLDNFWSGLMVGLACYSVLLMGQHGPAFTTITEGVWSIAYCLKPQTLIIFPLMSIVYHALLGNCNHRIAKTIALIFLSFVVQDTAYMFFYCPIYSTDALARNIFLMYFSLFVFMKSKAEIHLDKLLVFTILSLIILFAYTKTVFNGDMASDGFLWHDSLLKVIPTSLITLSIDKK